jgi:ubiquinol-cytochrome c reductase cytochrome b subunit
VIRRFLDALEARTGWVSAVARFMAEPVPGGPRWAYVFGSALVFLFAAQLASGAALALSYAPTSTDAWASVVHIEDAVALGRWTRAMHAHGASALVVLVLAHLVQVAWSGAYRKPREVNWWLGLSLFGLLLAFALTGSLLPWDDRGYWATRVATGIVGGTPLVGPAMERALVGGAQYGNATLTRFYALHALLLPALLVFLGFLHVALVRRHGITAPAHLAPGELQSRAEPFWPGQALRDAVFALALLAFVAAWSAVRAAPLDGPADPAGGSPPRPEWYFLPLFELLKHFPGPWEPVAAYVIPGVATALIFALPLLDRAPSRAARDRAHLLTPLFAGLLGAAALGAYAAARDAGDRAFLRQRARAEVRAARARELAALGVPPEGPLEMLRNQPEERGRRVFAQRCASCHPVGGDTRGKGPDLAGYLSERWLAAVIAHPDASEYFGRSGVSGMEPYGHLGMEKLTQLARFLKNGARDPPGSGGAAVFAAAGCGACHSIVPGEPGAGAPNLADYGSDAWLQGFIAEPAAPLYYGRDNRMPSFRTKLSERDTADVIAFLRLLGREPPVAESAAASARP